MAQIVSLLNGENINQDHQITALHKALINPGVISGLQVTSGQVQPGEAFVECTRSNGEKIMVLFQNTSTLNIDTSGTAKIYIEINQENINNGIINAEDGSNIGSIKRGSAYPNRNYVALASIQGGQITDERKIIQKRITDARRLNNPRLPKDYWTINSGGFSEVTEFNTASNLGIRGSANNYHTVYTTAWHDNSVKTTQLTYSPREIWTRSARDPDNWNDWQKVFPFSATALDISGLTEATEPVLSDELLIRSGGENKKVTADNLRKWSMIPFWNNSINKGEKTFDSWGGNTESYAVPRGGIVTIGCHSRNATYDNDGNYYIEHSTNNSSWNSLHNVSINSAHKTSTIIVPPGFVRLKGYRIDIHYTIQAFS